MFLAIDLVTKFAYVEFHVTAEMATGAAFLRCVVQAFPYCIRKLLTDNGVAFIKNASTRTLRPSGTPCVTRSIASAKSTASSTAWPRATRCPHGGGRRPAIRSPERDASGAGPCCAGWHGRKRRQPNPPAGLS